MQIYGYIRVSTTEQHIQRQNTALTQAGVPEKNIFTDKLSGKNFERPQYKKLLKKLKPGDQLIIKSLDRLGRNYKEIIEQWAIIMKKGADIKVLDNPMLDTNKQRDLINTLISDMILPLLSYIAQNERETLLLRQKEGIFEAKRRGVKFGRPTKDPPDNFSELVTQWEQKRLKTDDILEICNISRSTFYVKLKEYKLSRGTKK